MLKGLLKDAICSLKKTHVGILKWFEMLEGLEVSRETLVGKEVAPSSVLSLKDLDMDLVVNSRFKSQRHTVTQLH